MGSRFVLCKVGTIELVAVIISVLAFREGAFCFSSVASLKRAGRDKGWTKTTFFVHVSARIIAGLSHLKEESSCRMLCQSHPFFAKVIHPFS